MENQIRLSLFTHLIAPLGLCLLLFTLAYGAQLDFALASLLYNAQGGSWFLHHYWLTETLLHNHVRTLNETVLVGLVGYWVWQRVVVKNRSHKQRALGFLLLSLLLSFATVAVLKHLLPMECPWDLQQFGGNSAFWGLFDVRPASLATNQCFPAGHSSIGFAWLALYYYWRELKPQHAQRGLFIGLSLGLLLGFIQQLRGAHFISHDIATAGICWLVSTGLYLLSQRNQRAAMQITQGFPLASSTAVFPYISVESSDV